MRSEPACLGGIALDSPGILSNGHFPHEHAQVGQSGKVG